MKTQIFNIRNLQGRSLKFFLFLALFFLVNFKPALAQTQSQKTSAISNPDFKKVVDRALNFKVDTISVDALKKLTTSYVLLDAREREEYEVSHIENSLFFGYKDPDYSVLKNVDSQTEIIIYCSIGYRSEVMGKKLKRLGFSNVRNVYGSIFEWANKGYPLVNSQNEKTNVVHGYNKRWSKWVTNPSTKVTY